ncbi:MAG: hypothetical protein HYY50_00350 [Candidatus Kerfeldbacteria bacterium]|nr:hypothetical protein [Candidatus Kerfeldbacteria bacterium]
MPLQLLETSGREAGVLMPDDEAFTQLGVMIRRRTRWVLTSYAPQRVRVGGQPAPIGVARGLRSQDLVIIGDLPFRFRPVKPGSRH